MKYNEKQFYQSKTEPFETQEMSTGTKIELHYMNDEPFYMENINKSRFSSWASGDGKNYKLFVEKGLYEITSDLYTKEVNEIWLDFWATIDKMRKKYIFCIMLPMLGIFLAGLILITIFLPNQAWVFLVALVVILIASLFASSMLSRKMQMENINAATKVRDFIGVEKFKSIVDGQEKYIEKFYEDLQKKYEEEDRLAEEANNLDQIEAEENEAEAEETTAEEIKEDTEAVEANSEDTKEE
jgi:hypothetical protein